MVNGITVIVHFALHSITDIFLHNITQSSFNKSVAWIKYGVPLAKKVIAWLSIEYNERNCNVYLGKVCVQMYTMKSHTNELFRKMSANVVPPIFILLTYRLTILNMKLRWILSIFFYSLTKYKIIELSGPGYPS